MKLKYLIIAGIAAVATFTLTAQAVTCTNTFPSSLNNYSSGQCIPSAWANALEAKLGIDNSASTTSFDYLVNNLFTSYRSDIIKATSTQGLLQTLNNLSDLTDLVAARNNLGLGSAATRPSTDFLPSSTVISGATINGIATSSFVFAAAGPGLTVASSGFTITYTFSSSSLNLQQFLTAALQTLQGLSTSSITFTTSTASKTYDITTSNGNRIVFTTPPASDYLASSTVLFLTSTSTPVTSDTLPLFKSNGLITNSPLSISGGSLSAPTTTVTGAFSVNQGGLTAVQGVTTLGTTLTGNVVFGATAAPFVITTTTVLTAAQVCAAGTTIIVQSTSTVGTTTIFFPNQAALASSTCAPTIGSWAPQILYNSSTIPVQMVASSGESIYYTPPTPTVVPAFGAQDQWGLQLGGQFLFIFLGHQTSTPITVNGNTVTVSGALQDSNNNKFTTSTTFLANGGSFITTSTIGLTAGSNITITTSSAGTYTITGAAGGGAGGLTSSSPWTANFVPVILNGNQLTQGWIQFQTNGLKIATGTGTWPISSTSSALFTLGSSSIQNANASGTWIAINASSGFAGDFINLQTNSTTKFSVSSAGTVTQGTTNNLIIANSSGALGGWGGANCSGTGTSSAVYSISGTGTVTCAFFGNVTTAAPSTAANNVPYYITAASSTLAPTSTLTIQTAGGVNASGTLSVFGNAVSTSTPASLAGTYLGVSGNTLIASSTLASSTWNFIIYNATTTSNTTIISEWTAPQAGSLALFACHDTVGTTSLFFFEPTSDTTTTVSSTILSSQSCGVNGGSSSTVTSFGAGQAFIVEVTSTAGTPVSTPVHITYTKK